MENFIDLTQLEPIPYKNTIAVLNEYILQNIDFLNKFGHFNENKLFEMEVVIDEIESKLLLLEKKLESVPPEFFDGLVVPPLQQQQQVAQQQQPQQYINDNQGTFTTAAAPQAPPPPPPPQPPVQGQGYQPSPAMPEQMQFQPVQESQIQYQEPQPEEIQAEQAQEEEDPRIEKYKKLLSYGVMPAQLKMKMEMEGVDPNLLDKKVETYFEGQVTFIENVKEQIEYEKNFEILTYKIMRKVDKETQTEKTWKKEQKTVYKKTEMILKQIISEPSTNDDSILYTLKKA